MSKIVENEEKGNLSDYTVYKKIGKGQFSTVFRATRNSDNLIVALKKVPVFNK